MNILEQLAQAGNFIAAIEFSGRTPTLTMARVVTEELEGEDGKKKRKVIVYFNEVKRGWVLCKTTALCLAEMFGTETDKWSGKRVTLYAADVQVGPERKPGIRIVGSPDIEKPIAFLLKLPKKKAQKVMLKPTGKGAQSTLSDPEPEPAEDPMPPPDDLPSEPHEPITDPVTGEAF